MVERPGCERVEAYSATLEEFKRVGFTVSLVHRPLSDDPNDQLVLQIQGAVSTLRPFGREWC